MPTHYLKLANSIRRTLRCFSSARTHPDDVAKPHLTAARVVGSVSRLWSKKPSTIQPQFVVFSVLGVAGELDNNDAGWMMADYLAFVTMLACQPGFDIARSQHSCIRDIAQYFPDRTFLFGEAGLKPGEKLILLLIGHGTLSHEDGEFRFCIFTLGKRTGAAYLSKADLEMAVAGCPGEIVVICNSCYSGGLASPRWDLVCVGRPSQLAEALSQSSSGYVRASFAFCSLAGAGKEQGLKFPLPRSEKRPASFGMAELPPSSPTHSFTFPIRLFPAPSDAPLPVFIHTMLNLEQFLIHWYHVYPITSSPSVIDNIGLYPDADAIFPQTDGSSATLTLVAPADTRRILDVRAPGYAIGVKYWHLREGIEAALCRRYLDEPTPVSEVEVESLVDSLRSRNAQALAIQYVARHFGWWLGSTVAPFISLEQIGVGQHLIGEMGIAVDELHHRLLVKFEGRVNIFGSWDRASAWWLADRWGDYGKPNIWEAEHLSRGVKRGRGRCHGRSHPLGSKSLYSFNAFVYASAFAFQLIPRRFRLVALPMATDCILARPCNGLRDPDGQLRIASPW
ncbi:hypothetical protein B0H17DRAFT_1127476 [Mycena rosella]|uniref:CHAT domain-containing protein n=1 Tax=Mycena rosella TaxID=1033263 RepID=A0AAD7GR39_MYCRO|nr:hypothetical protein B0H17DRAFT_1127476 [Mycena rosella]